MHCPSAGDSVVLATSSLKWVFTSVLHDLHLSVPDPEHVAQVESHYSQVFTPGATTVLLYQPTPNTAYTVEQSA